MINQDAIRLLDHFCAQPSFFEDNQTAFLSKVLEYNGNAHGLKDNGLTVSELRPAYNCLIATVFSIPVVPEETRLDHQEAIYRDVIDTYRALSQHPVIEAFRTRFHCPDMSFVKVLDILFMRLGEILDQDGLELTPAEYLKEYTL